MLLPSSSPRNRLGWTQGLAHRGSADALQHSWQIVAYGLVGEAQHLIPRSVQEVFPLGVVLALGDVNLAVQLNGQATIGTAEIDDEWSDRMLAAKLQTRQPTTTQRFPEYCLGRGLARA